MPGKRAADKYLTNVNQDDDDSGDEDPGVFEQADAKTMAGRKYVGRRRRVAGGRERRAARAVGSGWRTRANLGRCTGGWVDGVGMGGRQCRTVVLHQMRPLQKRGHSKPVPRTAALGPVDICAMHAAFRVWKQTR